MATGIDEFIDDSRLSVAVEFVTRRPALPLCNGMDGPGAYTREAIAQRREVAELTRTICVLSRASSGRESRGGAAVEILIAVIIAVIVVQLALSVLTC